MVKLERRHFSAAMFGFAITGIFVSYQLLADFQTPVSRDTALMIVFIVLCPPSLMALAVNSEVGTNSFYFLWIIIAIMNAGLYAMTRLFISSRLQRRQR